ncbi:MAG: signal recognition particle-docking protein FtsY [Candidatus Poribacteria bacterium]|nr:signal recognition particle-docking protein FtsY [Candidatus Poribacteria bacterium]
MLRNLFRRKEEQQDIQTEEQEHSHSEGVQTPAEKPTMPPPADDAPDEKRGWFNRLKAGLAKTRNTIFGQISGLLRVGRTIDEELMEQIEEILIQADVGVNTTLKLMDNVRQAVREKGMKDASELEVVLKQEIIHILGQTDAPLNVEGHQPYTILIFGVNGAGKTTTIGKLAHRFRSDGKRVLVAAGDTFRAAAADQLAIWCDRAGVELIRGRAGSDPASVVFDAIQAAKSRQVDVLIVDTAGRLHTKKPLMDELSKIGRVMGRAIPEAPHEVLLVLDGTTGQNAIMQAKIFNETVPVTGVTVTKLDGTAKGGVVIAVKAEIGAPVKLIGIGEKLDDLRDFVARDFVEALFEREAAPEG